MRGGRDRADDTERRVFLHRDAVIPAHAERVQEFDARNVALAEELFDLMIQPADLGFFEFDSAPFLGVRIAKVFDDLNHLLATGHTFFR